MKRLIQAFIWWVTRTVVHCRYRVIVEGLDKIQDLRGPVLVMPNHPGYIDPVLVLSHIRFGRLLRPVVAETNYRLLFLDPLMRLVDALEVPELTGFSQEAQQRTIAMIDAVVAGLARGEGFVIYPSGAPSTMASRSSEPPVPSPEILTRSPQANVVLVRTRGLWEARSPMPGRVSRPSWVVAWRGDSAGLWPGCFLRSQRTVTMTIERVAREDLARNDTGNAQPVLGAMVQPPGARAAHIRPLPPPVRPASFQFPGNGHRRLDRSGEDPADNGRGGQRDD